MVRSLASLPGAIGASDAPQDAFIARQPILDRSQEVFAYELLSRSGPSNRFAGGDGDTATYRTIAQSFLLFGIEAIAQDKLAFVNVTQDVLLSDLLLALPPARVVVELLEDIVPDERVLEACRRLTEHGLRLAMDDFTPAHLGSPLLPLVDIVKVDFLATPPAERRPMIRELRRTRAFLLAEKVEHAADFRAALDEGFDYFQGYFFCAPVMTRRRDPQVAWANHGALLRQLGKPLLDFAEVEETLKKDPAMALRILRLVNSASFAQRAKLQSLKQAVVLLGERELRRWLWVVVLSEIATGKPSELMRLAAVRARFCELLAEPAGMRAEAQSLFLVGLLSLADAMLDCEMDEITRVFGVDPAITAALLGEENDLRKVHEVAVAYERGDWAAVDAAAAGSGIPVAELARLYPPAVAWGSRSN